MPTPDVTIIDYGVGNLLSVQRGLERHGAIVATSSAPNDVRQASRLVLPGVGAFSTAMELLHAKALIQAIHDAVSNKTPILGICLGMQLLFEESSEFGHTKGLGLIPGKVLPLPRVSASGEKLKSPNIGWRPLIPCQNNAPWRSTILDHVAAGDAAYFLHSFSALPSDDASRLADSLYGEHRIAAVVRHENIVGCQFHPEKSGKLGLKILGQFLASSRAEIRNQ